MFTEDESSARGSACACERAAAAVAPDAPVVNEEMSDMTPGMAEEEVEGSLSR